MKAGYFRMATDNPAHLTALIQSGSLPPTELTYALEAAGQMPDSQALITPYLSHEKAYVREGAVYGLGEQLTQAGVRDLLVLHAAGEASPGVREAIAEMLDTFSSPGRP